MFNTLSNLVKVKRYSFGVLAQIFYVGAQIMCWTYIYQYAESKGISNVEAGNYQMGAFVLFVIGRAAGTALLSKIKAGQLLAFFAAGALACLILVIVSNGLIGMYALVIVSFFMSLMFPTIYGIALGGLSKEESQIGSAGLVMAIVGGALMPKLQGMIIDLGGNRVNDISIFGLSEINFSFVLPVTCFMCIGLYGIMSSRKD